MYNMTCSGIPVHVHVYILYIRTSPLTDSNWSPLLSPPCLYTEMKQQFKVVYYTQANEKFFKLQVGCRDGGKRKGHKIRIDHTHGSVGWVTLQVPGNQQHKPYTVGVSITSMTSLSGISLRHNDMVALCNKTVPLSKPRV